jgi:hypothetical protein
VEKLDAADHAPEQDDTTDPIRKHDESEAQVQQSHTDLA